jgi:hypothetical protein
VDSVGLARVASSRARRPGAARERRGGAARERRGGAAILIRVAVGAFFMTMLVGAGAPGAPVRIDLWADRDDDDADGRADGQETPVAPPSFVDLVPLDPAWTGAPLRVLAGAEHARLVTKSGAVLPWGPSGVTTLPDGARLQGLSPGVVELLTTVRGDPVHVTVVVRGIDLRDGEGRLVDMAASHASIERTPPARIEGAPDALYDDFDALRVVLEVPPAAPVEAPGEDKAGERAIAVESVGAAGNRIDLLPSVPLSPSRCGRVSGARDSHGPRDSYDPRDARGPRDSHDPRDVHEPSDPLGCWASAPLRFVIDDVDRMHPLALGRSIKAEVGGAIVFRTSGRKAQMIRVLGPRSSAVGPIGRLRPTLRPFVVRVAPGGPPAIGGTEAGAIELLRGELAAAAAIWGQCGVTFGDPQKLDVRVVDPPPSHVLAVGDDLGVAASGGEIRVRVDGRPLTILTHAGETPDRVAAEVARVVEHAGLAAVVSPNARIGPALGPSVDVSMRRKDRTTLVAVDTQPGAPLSTDATLSVRIGSVDLSDGLLHFSDMDSMAGTLEERTLLKALDDGDPGTIEVVVVPLFAGGGRIGESFIGSDLSSVRNVVVLDRAGVRSRTSSLTLAHELGHVLMDLPGHPDDYGVDTPTLLMDSDAADASPFGPRRIPVEQCARMFRQSGPGARLPLLASWPVGPLGVPAIAR